MPKIKVTKYTKARIEYKLKLLFGQKIVIGKIYDSCIVSRGFIDDKPLKALYFENDELILSNEDQTYFVFLVGDMAAFKGCIFADNALTSISFREPITANTDFQKLKDRMRRVPPSLLEKVKKSVTA